MRPCRSTSAASPTSRLPPAVEAAAYFVTAEALTNVAKYAQASAASVELASRTTASASQVRDDGVGGADPSTGTGLRGLRDRVDALDGRARGRLAAGRRHDGHRRVPAAA